MSTSSITTLTFLVPALLFLAAHVAILGACIFGAMHPALRREFIWFCIGTLLQCIGSVITLIPQVMDMVSSASSRSYGSTRILYQINSGISLLSMVFIFVGFVLLAVRARSLPVVRN